MYSDYSCYVQKNTENINSVRLHIVCTSILWNNAKAMARRLHDRKCVFVYLNVSFRCSAKTVYGIMYRLNLKKLYAKCKNENAD